MSTGNGAIGDRSTAGQGQIPAIPDPPATPDPQAIQDPPTPPDPPAVDLLTRDKPRTLDELYALCRARVRARQAAALAATALLTVEREPIPPQPVRTVYLPRPGMLARGLIYATGVCWFVRREHGLREQLAVGDSATPFSPSERIWR